MTPRALAAIHADAFPGDRSWSADEFAGLLASPLVRLHVRPQGFALTRTVTDESELLTLAVAPASQRQGIGAALLRDWLAVAAQDAETAFLEVAADNHPAIALYREAGFETVSARPGYYARIGARPVDALLMRRALTLGQGGEWRASPPESG